MTLAEFILNSKEEYNGNKVLSINIIPTYDELIQLCAELEELSEKDSSFVIQTWADGSCAIYQKDFWKPCEHSLGHLDKLIVSFGED